MSSIKKIVTFIPAFIFLLPTIFSCSQDNSYEYIKILNSEDYIYKQDKERGFDAPDLTVQFEEHMAKKGRKVRVIMDTFDTNENMFNTLKTGKTKYDLICASDFMIQKLINLDLVENIDINNIPSYKDNASKFIIDKLSSLKLSNNKTLNDYAVGYMWGTLGIIYNPNYQTFIDRGISANQVFNDMLDWNELWDSKYKKTISIKDSMRDAYAAGILKTYSDQFLNSALTYEEKSKIFNYGCEDDPEAKKHIDEVKKNLITLRDNIFGFEVDGGKEDIVTGKIGIDQAWSGDAVYSIKKARNKEETTKPFDLNYSIPKQGANVWIDLWAMQKDAKKDLAYEFLNFISSPENAIQNTRYIGFTTAIAGEQMFEYYKNCYEYSGADAVDFNLDYFYGPNHSIKVSKQDSHGQMLAQFPNSSDIDRLYIMKDFGANNDLILDMWQDVKFEFLPPWAIALLIVEVVVIAGIITTFAIIKIRKKKQRKLRHNKTVKKEI